MMYYLLLVLALFAGHAHSSSSLPDTPFPEDVVQFSVGDCILAEFELDFVVFDNITNKNASRTMTVPTTAKVDGAQTNCGNETQDLSLMWTGQSANETGLERNITVVFARRNETAYGVQRIYGKFEVARFEWLNPKTNETLNATSYLDVDSGVDSELMFKIPYTRSYLCKDTGAVQLSAHFHYTIPDQPSQGTLMRNATATFKRVQFDAFRTADTKPKGYRTPMDCDFQPNDIVPIVVGVALAGLVILVLIAYLIGRRKNRQRGYQSV